MQKNRKPLILPLSSNPDLDEEKYTGLSVYHDSLSEAFANPRIQNIAVVGEYGVGKSSILQSFDLSRRFVVPPFRKRTKFLYVSMGRYEQPTLSEEHKKEMEGAIAEEKCALKRGEGEQAQGGQAQGGQAQGGQAQGGQAQGGQAQGGQAQGGQAQGEQVQGEKDKGIITQTDNKNQNDALEKNVVEHRVLLQMFSRFKQKVFLASDFRLVPEQPGKIKTFLAALWIVSIVLLILKKPIAELVCTWKPSVLQGVINYIKNYHECFELSLYVLCILGVMCFAGWIYRFMSPKLQKLHLSIKGNNAEVSMESNTSGDYIDRYTQELVYCFKQIGRKIDRTVVFEDMDRLDPAVCVQIYIRLRELNHVINTHLSRRKYVRFVFAANERIVSKLQMDKFFDYVMPVVPSLTVASAPAIFLNELAEIDDALEKERELKEKYSKNENSTKRICRWVVKKLYIMRKRGKQRSVRWLADGCFRNLTKNLNVDTNLPSGEDDAKNNVAERTAPFVDSYRKMYAILNDYVHLRRLFEHNNQEDNENNKKESILAFAVYKHMWPEDYQRIATSEAVMFTGESDGVDKGERKVLLDHFLDEGLLKLESIQYAGFPKNRIAGMLEKLLQKKLDAVDEFDVFLRRLDSDNPLHLRALMNVCCLGTGSQSETSATGSSVNETVLEKAIFFVATCKKPDEEVKKWLISSIKSLVIKKKYDYVKQIIAEAIRWEEPIHRNAVWEACRLWKEKSQGIVVLFTNCNRDVITMAMRFLAKATIQKFSDQDGKWFRLGLEFLKLKGDFNSIGTIMGLMNPYNDKVYCSVTKFCQDISGSHVRNIVVLQMAIRFVLRKRLPRNQEADWFFRGRTVYECLEVLAGLEDNEWREFLERNYNGKSSLFNLCTPPVVDKEALETRHKTIIDFANSIIEGEE